MPIRAGVPTASRARRAITLLLAVTLGFTGIIVAHDARANQTPVEANYLCVNPGGVVRYATSPNCGNNETLITMPDDAPLTLCAPSGNGAIKDVTLTGGTCPSGQTTINVPSPTRVFFCAHRNNGKLSQTGNPPSCKKNEFPVFFNTFPSAANDTYSTPEDTQLSVSAPGVLGNDSDPDGQPLSAVLVSGPGNGSLTLNADGSFVYTPNANFNGSDSFTYRADDGDYPSNIATVTLTVTSVNDAPVAVGETYTTDEDATLVVAAPGVLANDSDIDSPSLTAAVVDAPANGTLVLNADGSFTYNPNANFIGSDSFTYTASDGQATSAPATVTILVSSTNDAPTANDDGYATDEDSQLVIAAPGVLDNDTDPDGGDTISAILDTDVTNGSLALSADGSFTYTPNGGFNGVDSFTYRASDGSLESAPATVTITVNAVNDPPVAGDDAYTAIGNTTLLVGDGPAVTGPSVAVPGTLLDGDSDPDGPALSVQPFAGTSANGGDLTIDADGTFVYLPAPGFRGVDTFTYTVTDGTDSAVGNVSITVGQVVWYVEGDAANDGNGRSNAPFNSLASYTANAADEAYDIIFLYSSSSDYSGGVTLLNNQQLFGEPGGLEVEGDVLVAPGGNNPVITNASGNGVTLGFNNTVRAVDVDGVSGDGIAGTTVGRLIIEQVNVHGAENGVAIVTSSGTSTALISDSSFDGLDADGVEARVHGNSTVLNLTVELSDFDDPGNGDNGVSIRTTDAATVRFNVAGNTVDAFNAGIIVQANDASNVQGTIDGNTVVSTNGSGLNLTADDDATVVIAATNNAVTASGQEGVFVVATNTSTLDLTLTGNTVATPDDIFFIGINSVYLLAFNDAELRLDISGNTVANGTGFAPYDAGIHIEQFSSVAVGLDGYVAGDPADFLDSPQNNSTAAVSDFGNGFAGATTADPEVTPLP